MTATILFKGTKWLLEWPDVSLKLKNVACPCNPADFVVMVPSAFPWKKLIERKLFCHIVQKMSMRKRPGRWRSIWRERGCRCEWTVESRAQPWDCSEIRFSRAVKALERNACISKYNGNNWRVLSKCLMWADLYLEITGCFEDTGWEGLGAGNRGPVRSLCSSQRHDSAARRIFDSEILERIVGQPCYLINQDTAFPTCDRPQRP